MNTKSEYHYLTRLGALKGLAKTYPNIDKKTFLVLDSSVCLDIVSIVNKRNIAKESKRKAFELLRYSQKKSFPPFDIFALLELSIDKITYKVNTDKFLDLSNKLKFAFQFPLERLKKGDFNFSTNFYQPVKPKLKNDASSVVGQILVHYCALLKVREITCKGIGKQNAKKNLIEFIDWMDSELGFILGLEYQLAFQILGGNNKFNAMIKESSNKDKALKALWGSSWDLFHARVSRNSRQLSGIVNEDVNSIFITNDKRLYDLLSPQIELSTEVNKSILSITEGTEIYPPYYDTGFVKEINEKLLNIYEKRFLVKAEYPDKEMVKSMIVNMENKIN